MYIIYYGACFYSRLNMPSYPRSVFDAHHVSITLRFLCIEYENMTCCVCCLLIACTSRSSANTLKRIYNWPSSVCYILGKVFGEKYK